MVGPLVLLGWNHIGVGIEKDGGESEVGALPFDKKERFVFNELDCLVLEREGVGLRDEELDCFVVVRSGLGSVDL